MYFFCGQFWNEPLSSKLGDNFNCVYVISIQLTVSACFYVVYKRSKMLMCRSLSSKQCWLVLNWDIFLQEGFYGSKGGGALQRSGGIYHFFTISKHKIWTLTRGISMNRCGMSPPCIHYWFWLVTNQQI